MLKSSSGENNKIVVSGNIVTVRLQLNQTTVKSTTCKPCRAFDKKKDKKGKKDKKDDKKNKKNGRGSASPNMGDNLAWATGARVEVNYQGKGRYHPGRVSRSRPNGTYDIAYNDGEQQLGVESSMIRASSPQTQAPQAGSPTAPETNLFKMSGGYDLMDGIAAMEAAEQNKKQAAEQKIEAHKQAALSAEKKKIQDYHLNSA